MLKRSDQKKISLGRRLAPRRFVGLFLMLVALALVLCAVTIIAVDPFFHYHAPLPGLYYELGATREQNDGITRHFGYDAVITGTSMAESFRASEFDTIFGTRCIKVCYPGATLRETGDNLRVAWDTAADRGEDGPVIVLRSMDISMLLTRPDAMRDDMGVYPVYLTDDSLLNDVQYWWNRDALGYAARSLAGALLGREGGVTSFDEYGFDGELGVKDGPAPFLGEESEYEPAEVQEHLTAEEYDMLRANLEANVISIAEEHPDTRFICFIPPYSMVYWGKCLGNGTLERTLELEEAAVRQLIRTPNIELYSFNTDAELTGDLTRYRDPGHYDYEVNSLILSRIAGEPDIWRITPDNVDEYVQQEASLHRQYDYLDMFSK